MGKIKGQNFRALVGGSVVSEATNCSITITGNTEDTSTKDSEGLFTQETVVSTAWQVQVEGYDASPGTVQALVTTFNAAQPVNVGWDQTTGAGNGSASGADFSRSGMALLNDLTIVFNDRQTCNVTQQYQGTGPLS